MAASTNDAMATVKKVYQDLLVQLGKHYLTAATDGPGSLAEAHTTMRAKAEDSLIGHHLACNDIEHEIIRAKAVLLRDLEKLRAARTPAPAPVTVPVQPVAPPAPMMELPSAAAHNLNPPRPYAANTETKTVAPFPDMGLGMGMSSDVIDLTLGAKNPTQSSPRLQSGSVKPPVARGTPPIKNEARPSPKPTPKPTPPAPAKVTPVPVPQIPRLPTPGQTPTPNPASQPKPQPPAQAPKAAQQARPAQITQTVKPAQDMISNTAEPLLANTNSSNVQGTNGSELTFTDMEFSLAPPPSDPQGAPPAPMPEFDLAAFAPPPGGSNESTNLETNTKSVNSNTALQADPINAQNTNIDDMFNLGNGGSDNMFDLGGGEVNDSAFDDLMYFDGNTDHDMAQFDDAYFGL